MNAKEKSTLYWKRAKWKWFRTLLKVACQRKIHLKDSIWFFEKCLSEHSRRHLSRAILLHLEWFYFSYGKEPQKMLLRYLHRRTGSWSSCIRVVRWRRWDLPTIFTYIPTSSSFSFQHQKQLKISWNSVLDRLVWENKAECSCITKDRHFTGWSRTSWFR